MAEWGAKRVKKTCEQCEKLANSVNFPKGVRARIAGVYECDTCEVTKHQPLPENENIVTLYNALPQNFDGYSGIRLISATDIKFVLELFEVYEDLWSDYYQKLLYFHSQYTERAIKEREAHRKAEAWKKKGLKGLKGKRTH